jgi:hypothetical protein
LGFHPEESRKGGIIMNKLVIVGIILVILGVAGVGASFITAPKTESFTEMVPATRDITVQEQVPKTREVEKQKTQTVRENVPFFEKRIVETVKFEIQSEPQLAPWAPWDYRFESSDPVEFVIKQPAHSRKGELRWTIQFTAKAKVNVVGSFGQATYNDPFTAYFHESPEAYICQYKIMGESDCIRENVKPNEYTIIIDPLKLVNDEMRERFKTQKTVNVKIFFSSWEMKSGEWSPIPLTSTDALKIPYLEVHLFDHYEMQNVQKLVTYKETETYYVTENVTKQEEYQKEETKTHEVTVRPYGLGLWVSIGLLAAAVVLIALGSRKSGVEQVASVPSEMRCPKCGKENSAESVFCTNCGTQLK